jgi:hypothetical protein
MTIRGHHGLLFGAGGGPATDPFFADVLLLMRGEVSPLVDESPSPKTVSEFGGIAHTSTSPLSETGSILCDGTDDYCDVGVAGDWNFGASEHSIELKVRFASLPGSGAVVMISTRTDGGFGKGFEIVFTAGTGGGYAAWYDNAGSLTVLSFAASSFTPGVDYDIGVFRDHSGTPAWRLFLDGAHVASTTSLATFAAPDRPLTIGALQASPPTVIRHMHGRIEARITAACRHAGTGAYTPDAAWPTS